MLNQVGLFDAPMVRRSSVSERACPSKISKIVAKVTKSLAAIETLSLEDKVEAINAIREHLHNISPFRNEPVDLVLWVPSEALCANDYNPNAVAPPEMELLRLSIMADGYTQPIVTNSEGDKRVVVDGFHRNRVGKECEDVANRVMGYLPTVQIRTEQTDKPDRMASTVRHNRARGKHRVDGMSEIVLELRRRNWSNEKIGKQLGMDPDEVLRLAQITGLAEMFADRQFSEAWEANPDALLSDKGGELIENDDEELGSEADGVIVDGRD